MNKQPRRSTPAGRAYLDLQRRARAESKPTQELLVRYVHERFLFRLSGSAHRHRLVLKGGMLLAVFDVRRATGDLDMLARGVDNQTVAVTRLVTDVAALDVDDGVQFDAHSIRADVIRQDDRYPGVRVHVVARVATAQISLTTGCQLRRSGYPNPSRSSTGAPRPAVPAVAEKIETIVRRG